MTPPARALFDLTADDTDAVYAVRGPNFTCRSPARRSLVGESGCRTGLPWLRSAAPPPAEVAGGCVARNWSAWLIAQRSGAATRLSVAQDSTRLPRAIAEAPVHTRPAACGLLRAVERSSWWHRPTRCARVSGHELSGGDRPRSPCLREMAYLRWQFYFLTAVITALNSTPQQLDDSQWAARNKLRSHQTPDTFSKEFTEHYAMGAQNQPMNTSSNRAFQQRFVSVL